MIFILIFIDISDRRFYGNSWDYLKRDAMETVTIKSQRPRLTYPGPMPGTLLNRMPPISSPSPQEGTPLPTIQPDDADNMIDAATAEDPYTNDVSPICDGCKVPLSYCLCPADDDGSALSFPP